MATFGNQRRLPPLPLPALDDTLDELLASGAPLCRDAREAAAFAAAVAVLRTAGGPLHDALQTRAGQRRNWLESWWEDGYAGYRGRNAFYVNWFAAVPPFVRVVMPSLPQLPGFAAGAGLSAACIPSRYVAAAAAAAAAPAPSAGASAPAAAIAAAAVALPELTQAEAAAWLAVGLLQLRRDLEEGRVPPEEAADSSPLCMAQYERLFTSCMVPRPGRDELRRFPRPADHIAVLCHGHTFLLPVGPAALGGGLAGGVRDGNSSGGGGMSGGGGGDGSSGGYGDVTAAEATAASFVSGEGEEDGGNGDRSSGSNGSVASRGCFVGKPSGAGGDSSGYGAYGHAAVAAVAEGLQWILDRCCGYGDGGGGDGGGRLPRRGPDVSVLTSDRREDWAAVRVSVQSSPLLSL
ncbi:unnamed protein product [Phaeothamnion confervicola]